MSYYKSLNRTERLLYLLAIAVILFGVVIRIVVWLQNRNLIIDEANIARNLYERDFGALTKPLSYEQYAPIFFLWVEKLTTILFGFSEYALKSYPLVCSFGVLIMLMLVLKEYVQLRIIWYPLMLFAGGFFFIRYSTEVKQYMSDALVVLLVIYAALKISITETETKKFVLNWLLIGALAIISAMPSVFALAGVGGYYFWQCRESKKYSKIVPFALVAGIWIVEFGLYYILLLRDQAHSQYLQNYHANFFLVATPTTAREFEHNWYVITELISLSSGYHAMAKLFNYSLLGLGSILLIYKNTRKGLLVVLPIFFTLVASAVNEFSLIPRVALFMMPLFLVVIAYAIDVLMSLRPAFLKYVLGGLALLFGLMHVERKLLRQPFYNEEITRAMQLMKDNSVRGEQVNISHGSVPAFTYYTQIHPDKQRWFTLAGAQLRNWDADWSKVAAEANGRFGALFTTVSRADAAQYRNKMLASAKMFASIEDSTAKCYAYVLEK